MALLRPAGRPVRWVGVNLPPRQVSGGEPAAERAEHNLTVRVGSPGCSWLAWRQLPAAPYILGRRPDGLYNCFLFGASPVEYFSVTMPRGALRRVAGLVRRAATAGSATESFNTVPIYCVNGTHINCICCSNRSMSTASSLFSSDGESRRCWGVPQSRGAGW